MKIVFRIILGLLLLLCALAVFVVLPILPSINEEAKLGVTFSPRAAEFLGLDWKDAFMATLNDLQPDTIRIPIYWNVLEPNKDDYHWEDFDYQLDAIKQTNTQIILAIGHKLPRWPECHLPEWIANESNEEEIEAELYAMVEDVVIRYKDHPNLVAYQVQNEVLFDFGDCPEWSGKRSRLKGLIERVKEIDRDTKVTTSDSGELSLWLRTSTLPIDALNVSLYRAVYNEKHDYFYWPVNPYYYKLHALFVKPFVSELIISELQLEPWGPTSVEALDQEEIYKSITPIEMINRVDFAKRTGASTILGWGVEWWYYMKEVRNDSDFWNTAIKLYQPGYDRE